MARETPAPTPHHRVVNRTTTTAVRVFATAAAVIGAAIAASAPAQADTGTSTLLDGVGIGNNGAISQAIAQVATSLCPMFVQPGSELATAATTASGHGGLGSQVAGGVAGLVIQSQCPSFMTSLANGDFSVLSNAASMVGMAAPGN